MMAAHFPKDVEYLVFTVDHNRFGVPHFDVVSVMDMPPCTLVPHMPSTVRGVIAFREHNIPLFDLRLCFGAEPHGIETETLVTTMEQRKQDHINWLNKLKDEVFHNKPITVQTDPHLCAFGKWYDRFQSNNMNLTAYMRRFDQPHKEIHQVAVTAAQLIGQGQTAQAQALVHATENGVLVRLLELFDGIGDQVRKYLLEYAIVLQVDGELFAVAVDDINFFSRLTQIESHLPPGLITHQSDLVQALGRYRAEGQSEERDVLLLDMNQITAQAA